MSRKRNAYQVYMTLSAVQAAAFTLIFTVNLIYQVKTIQLNPLQLALVGTALEASAFICEVPTGIVADIYSRRLSVIISMLLTGIAFVVQGTVGTFAGMLIGSMLWGLGWTFQSGALEAWVADELGEDAAGKAYIRASQVGTLAYIPMVVVSMLLAQIALNVPVVTGGLIFLVLGTFLMLFMPEHGFAPTRREERNSWQQMVHTFTQGTRAVRGRPVLTTILVIGAIYGAFSEGYDRLWTAHILRDFSLPPLGVGRFEEVIWFGALRIASALIGLGPQEYIARRLDMTHIQSMARALLAINTLLIAAVIAFALAGNLALALAATLVIGPLRSLDGPLRMAWINQRLDPQVRATVLSMFGQVDALGQVGGGPVFGAIGLRAGMRDALAAAGITLSPAVVLYGLTQRAQRSKGQPPESSEPVSR